VNKSTVSRWRENLVPNMSLLLAILISNRDGVKGDFEAEEKAKAAVLEHQRLSGAKTESNCEVIMTNSNSKHQARES
jgi:hypothetical protein